MGPDFEHASGVLGRLAQSLPAGLARFAWPISSVGASPESCCASLKAPALSLLAGHGLHAAPAFGEAGRAVLAAAWGPLFRHVLPFLFVEFSVYGSGRCYRRR